MRSVLYFCSSMGRQSEEQSTPEHLAVRRRFLRAALAEFASLDEATSIDMKARKKVAKMLELDDPRIHIVRLLRHANVHLAVSDVTQSCRDVEWANHEFQFQIFYSKDIKASILQTEQAPKYAVDDLAEMIQWLEEEQMEWGLDHLVLRTAELYAHLVL